MANRLSAVLDQDFEVLVPVVMPDVDWVAPIAERSWTASSIVAGSLARLNIKIARSRDAEEPAATRTFRRRLGRAGSSHVHVVSGSRGGTWSTLQTVKTFMTSSP